MTTAQKRNLILFCGLTALILPFAAHAEPEALRGGLQKLLDIFTSPSARILASCAIAAFGVLCMRGMVDWRFGGSVIAGIIIVFGAASIANYWTGG